MLIAENFRGCLIMAGLDVTPDTPQVKRGADWDLPKDSPQTTDNACIAATYLLVLVLLLNIMLFFFTCFGLTKLNLNMHGFFFFFTARMLLGQFWFAKL